MTRASAPGKIILFGEHAVVYGQPALAVPVPDLQAIAEVHALPESMEGILIEAPDMGKEAWLRSLPEDDPLARVIHLTFNALSISPPALRLRITSTIPIAAGLGSGAAVSIAVIRALAIHMGKRLPIEQVSQLAFEVERIHHGSPSGIDNTVIAYNRPVWYQRGREPETFRLRNPLQLVIADSGIHVPTSKPVSLVRERYTITPESIQPLFDQIGRLARQARKGLEQGDLASLGSLMNENQMLLRSLGVSSPILDQLISIVQEQGALGAKLSGAGMGGNIIALVHQEPQIMMQKLKLAGASQVFYTRIEP